MNGALPIVEWTITFGGIVNMVMFMGTAISLYYAHKNELAVIKIDLKHLHDAQRTLTEAFNQLGKILTQVAVQDSRIAMIEKKLDELSHGDGYVRKRK